MKWLAIERSGFKISESMHATKLFPTKLVIPQASFIAMLIQHQ